MAPFQILLETTDPSTPRPFPPENYVILKSLKRLGKNSLLSEGGRRKRLTCKGTKNYVDFSELLRSSRVLRCP